MIILDFICHLYAKNAIFKLRSEIPTSSFRAFQVHDARRQKKVPVCYIYRPEVWLRCFLVQFTSHRVLLSLYTSR